MTQQAATAATDATPRPRLLFDEGTILVEGLAEGEDLGLPGVKFDPRAGMYRAEAIWYREIVQHLLDKEIARVDDARAYEKVTWTFQVTKEAFPHQTEGLDAWWKAHGRG